MGNVSIINSYTNTDELLKKFPIANPTPVTIQMEKNIQNRLLAGFANWNEGYEAYEIPNEEDLVKKYPIVNPTTANIIRESLWN